MKRIEIKYTDFKESGLMVNELRFDQGNIVLSHPDFSTEYINRSFVKSVRIWREDEIPV